jgi:hypothetical protein
VIKRLARLAEDVPYWSRFWVSTPEGTIEVEVEYTGPYLPDFMSECALVAWLSRVARERPEAVSPYSVACLVAKLYSRALTGAPVKVTARMPGRRETTAYGINGVVVAGADPN